MADVKKLNGYNIKDETARNGLLTKQDKLTSANAGDNITIEEVEGVVKISAEAGLPAGEPNSLYGTDSNGEPIVYKVKDGLVLERPVLPDGYTEVEYISSDWANEAHVEEISTDRITVSCNVNPPRKPYISFFEQATQYVHFEVVSAMFECVDFNGYTNWKIHCYDKDGNEALYYEHESTSGLHQYWLIDVQGEIHFGDYFILERTGWDRRQYIDTGVVLDRVLSYDWDKTNGRSYNYAGVNVEINPTAEFDEYMRNGGYIKFKAQNDGLNDNFAYGINGSYTSVASASWIKEHYGIDITGDIVYASYDAEEAVHTVIWLNKSTAYPRYIIHTNAYVEDTTNTYLKVLGANNGNNSGIFCSLNGISNYYGWKTMYISYASLGLPVYKGWNDITIDNATTQSYHWQNTIVNGNSSLQSFTSCYDSSNILLFTANMSGSAATSASLKMKRTTIQKDGVIVFDGVPAIRNSDGVAGMYDMANNVFKTSESAGDFVAGPVVEYPTINVEEETEIKNDIDDEVEVVKGFENDEYVQLTWLKSNGNQVIDLGISGAANHEYEICFKCDGLGSSTTGNTRPLFGIYSTTLSQTPGYALKLLNNKLYRVFATGSVGVEQEVCGWDDDWHVVRTKKSYTAIDGVETRNMSSSDNYIDSSWGLFGVKTGSPDNWSFPSPYSYFVGKISYFRDYCSGILVREFVPVRRKSDGQLGFYCIQEDRFCPNVITGYQEGFQGGEIFGTRVIKKNTSDILPGESIYNTIQKQRVNTYGNLSYGYQTSYGSNARPDGPNTTVIGANASAINSTGRNTVVGANAETGSYYNTLVGAYSIAQGMNSTVIGYASRTDGSCSVVVGNCRGRDNSGTYTTGNYTVSVGYGIGARGSNQCVFIGNSISLSNLSSGHVTWAVCIGDNAQIGANYGIAIGSQANIHAGAVNSVAIGSNAHAYSIHSVAIGNSATVNYSSNYSTAIGYHATVESNYGIQLGYGYNNETASLYVGFGTDYGNYKLLGSTGVIPYQRLTTATAVDGYCLKYDANSDSLVWGEAGGSYELPIASSNTLGGIKVGSGLSINSSTGVLSADAQALQPATRSRLGGVKVGNGLSVANDGTLSANVQSLNFEDIGGEPQDNQALSDALTGLQNNINTVQDNLNTVESDLQAQIDNMSSIGEFLAIWDCDTGIARYLNAGFVYPTGGYFIIGAVAAQGQPNYMPDGSTYTGPSTTTTTEDVKVSDMWFYDGTHWIYLANHERQIAVDADLSTTSANPVENRVITAALNDKQDTLTAGKGIEITDNVISVANDSVGVPQIANVYAKQLNKAEQATARMAKESYLGFYSDICFNLNLSKEQIIDKMDELYIGLERFKRNRVSSALSDPEDEESEEIDYRNIPAFKLQNDHFVHTDRKMYCYRYNYSGYDDPTDERNYIYFYSNNEYSTYQDMFKEDLSIYCFYGVYTTGNKASCLNTLRSMGIFSDYEDGVAGWERYPDGDIEVFVNVNKGDSIANGYITLRVCRQYIVNGQKEYYWSPDWEDPATNIYAMTSKKIPTSYTGALEEVGTVEDLDGYEYVKRPDLNYWTFNFDAYNLSDWIEELLEPNTLQGAAWGDGSRTISWRCYWLDYPLQPVLLQDCDVINKDGNWTKLKDVIADGDEDNLPENITFRYPYNSAEIWLRFSAWQKRCMYNEFKEETKEYLPLSQKQALVYAWEWDQGYSIKNRRAFGRQRNMYSSSGEHTKISEYIQFNLYEPYNVYGGTKSKSTPIQKRITINAQNGSTCIRN